MRVGISLINSESIIGILWGVKVILYVLCEFSRGNEADKIKSDLEKFIRNRQTSYAIDRSVTTINMKFISSPNHMCEQLVLLLTLFYFRLTGPLHELPSNLF